MDWRMIALALLVPALLAPRPALAQGSSERAQLHRRLQHLVEDTHSVSWVEEAWERQGSRTETSRERGLWSSDGQMRLEVLAGRGRGAVVSSDGDAVTVQLPSMLRHFKRHYRADDPAVRSLRGHGPDEAGFMPDLAQALQRWDEVRLHRDGRQVVLAFPTAQGLEEHLWLPLDTLVPTRAEVLEDGQVVERKSFQQAVLNPD